SLVRGPAQYLVMQLPERLVPGGSPLAFLSSNAEGEDRVVPQEEGARRDPRTFEGGRHRQRPGLSLPPLTLPQVDDLHEPSPRINHQTEPDLLGRVAERRHIPPGREPIVIARQRGQRGHDRISGEPGSGTATTPLSSRARKNIAFR